MNAPHNTRTSLSTKLADKLIVDKLIESLKLANTKHDLDSLVTVNVLNELVSGHEVTTETVTTDSGYDLYMSLAHNKYLLAVANDFPSLVS